MARMLLLALLFVAALPLGAQTAEEIVARHLEARGGREAIRAVQTILARGTLTLAGGLESPFEWAWERSGRFRLAFEFRGQAGAVGFDGQAPWADLPFLPNPQAAFAGVPLAVVQDFDGPLLADGVSVELIGVEKVGKDETFRLRVVAAEGAVRELFIASDGYQLLREDRIGGEPPAIEATTTCSDFRQVGEIELPFRCDARAAAGDPADTVSLDEVELGAAVDEALFAAPAR